MAAWLEEDDLENKWTQVITEDGEFAGWIDSYNANILNLDYHIVETPKRFLTDPFIRQHAIFANHLNLLQGNNLSEIQQVLVATNIKKEWDDAEEIRVRQFEENMWVNNQDLWKSYTDHKKQMQAMEDIAEVEETVPSSIEEFFEALSAFTEGGESSSEDQDIGWLDSILDDDDLSQMED